MVNDLLPLSRRTLLAGAIGALALVGLTGAAGAGEWPDRPVTMVVPFGPGASNDTFTRALSDALSHNLGQPFVVENQPGAGGFTATLGVSRAKPDGYTFVEMASSIVGFGPIMGVQLDPLADVTPIALFARAPNAMVVPADLPVKSVAEFIDYAKSHPDNTFVGYAGVGSTQQQAAVLFEKVSGLKLNGVNYKSSADVQTDLVAGRLQLMFGTVASVRGQVDAGQLRILAYTNDRYPPDSPKAPTMAEAGVDGMEGSEIWWGIFGPKGMPADLAAKMNAAINKALDDPKLAKVMNRSGAVPAKTSPEEFAAAINDEKARVKDFVEFTGTKPQ